MAGAPTITPGGVPDGKRRRTQASTKLLHEWSLTQLWDSPPVYEYRLGPTPLLAGAVPVDQRVEGMLRRANRYADLVGPIFPYLKVVECKVVADPSAISQLQHYVNLVTSTPLPAAWQGLVVQPVLLWAIDDPLVHQTATQNGITVVIYDPPWVAEYLASKFYRP